MPALTPPCCPCRHSLPHVLPFPQLCLLPDGHFCPRLSVILKPLSFSNHRREFVRPQLSRLLPSCLPLPSVPLPCLVCYAALSLVSFCPAACPCRCSLFLPLSSSPCDRRPAHVSRMLTDLCCALRLLSEAATPLFPRFFFSDGGLEFTMLTSVCCALRALPPPGLAEKTHLPRNVSCPVCGASLRRVVAVRSIQIHSNMLTHPARVRRHAVLEHDRRG